MKTINKIKKEIYHFSVCWGMHFPNNLLLIFIHPSHIYVMQKSVTKQTKSVSPSSYEHMYVLYICGCIYKTLYKMSFVFTWELHAI